MRTAQWSRSWNGSQLVFKQGRVHLLPKSWDSSHLVSKVSLQCLLLASKLLNNRQLTNLKGPRKARKVLGLSKGAMTCVLYSARESETDERFPPVLQKHAVDNTVTFQLYCSQGWRISAFVFPTSKQLYAVSITTDRLLFNMRYILKTRPSRVVIRCHDELWVSWYFYSNSSITFGCVIKKDHIHFVGIFKMRPCWHLLQLWKYVRVWTSLPPSFVPLP